MKKANLESLLNSFLVLMIISLVGNSCADFALIWYSIAQLGGKAGDAAASSHLLSSFYLGQSIGVIFLAPALAAWVDHSSKRVASIVLDCTYALFLVGLVLVDRAVGLSPMVLLPFALVTAALGFLHKNSICFSALKVVSGEMDATKVAAKYSAALYFTNMVGSVISGIVFKWVGLDGCLLIAILTFLPMPFIYFKLFSAKASAPPIAKVAPALRKNIFRELAVGLRFIWADRIMFWLAISSAILNLASNIYPGIVGIAFQRTFPGRTDFAAGGVACAIFMGFLAFKPLSQVARRFSLNRILPLGFFLPILSVLLCSVFPNPFLFTFAFAVQCCGAAFHNIAAGSLRVKRVPSQFTGRVNTAYSAIVYVGHMLGGLLLIPLMENNLSLGALAIAGAFTAASVVAFNFLPTPKLDLLLEEAA